MIISITGDLGSGKSTVCNILSEKYNLKIISMGIIQRDLAQKYKMSTYEFNLFTEKHPEIDDEIDNNLIKLSDNKENTEDYVVDSRMAWFFIPNSFKVYLTVDLLTAAKRIMNDVRCTESYASIEEAATMLQLRKISENKRFMKKYNVNCKDLHNFDLVIDSSQIPPVMIAEQIYSFAKSFFCSLI